MPDAERTERIQRALAAEKLDAVVCALPVYVLLLTGYWPVVGTSVAVATSDGRRVLLVPEDEKKLAAVNEADELRTYRPSSLDRVQSVAQAAATPLRQILRDLKLTCARVGYELGPASEPASYAAMHLFGGSMVTLLREAAPANALAPADELLSRLAAVKTPAEIERIRTACRIAGAAFEQGQAHLRPGLQETEAAELFRAPVVVIGNAWPGVQRADGFAWCMSGPNSAGASGAFARSTSRKIAAHEFLLVHCNSHADGCWTDITRTYVLGALNSRQRGLYDAVFAARAAALAVIRPGARAADVDRAARDVMRSRGLEQAFRHSTGHGIGFASISANALPRIHPHSEDVLESGMVFNVEPAAYFDGYGGLRHCDVVAVAASGAALLTPFQQTGADMVLDRAPAAA
ncbi:MAG: M24 family metallopeptidase [Terriglobales bacterium]